MSQERLDVLTVAWPRFSAPLARQSLRQVGCLLLTLPPMCNPAMVVHGWGEPSTVIDVYLMPAVDSMIRARLQNTLNMQLQRRVDLYNLRYGMYWYIARGT